MKCFIEDSTPVAVDFFGDKVFPEPSEMFSTPSNVDAPVQQRLDTLYKSVISYQEEVAVVCLGAEQAQAFLEELDALGYIWSSGWLLVEQPFTPTPGTNGGCVFMLYNHEIYAGTMGRKSVRTLCGEFLDIELFDCPAFFYTDIHSKRAISRC